MTVTKMCSPTKTCAVTAFMLLISGLLIPGLCKIEKRSDKGVKVTGLPGMKGDKGDTGPKGFKGFDGVFGAESPKGVKGADGDQGESGSKGYVGEKGKTGLRGEKGTSGDQGIKGHIGFIGFPGIKGMPGLDGVMAQDGDKGEKGIKGIQGLTGLKGDKGQSNNSGFNKKGSYGNIGRQGKKGLKGRKGISGVKGNSAVKGKQSEKGYTGGRGTKGFLEKVGDIGEKGVKGYVGVAGRKGEKGKVGNNFVGLPGIKQPDGAKGNKGEPGPMGIKGPDGENAGEVKEEEGAFFDYFMTSATTAPAAEAQSTNDDTANENSEEEPTPSPSSSSSSPSPSLNTRKRQLIVQNLVLAQRQIMNMYMELEALNRIICSRQINIPICKELHLLGTSGLEGDMKLFPINDNVLHSSPFYCVGNKTCVKPENAKLVLNKDQWPEEEGRFSVLNGDDKITYPSLDNIFKTNWDKIEQNISYTCFKHGNNNNLMHPSNTIILYGFDGFVHDMAPTHWDDCIANEVRVLKLTAGNLPIVDFEVPKNMPPGGKVNIELGPVCFT